MPNHQQTQLQPYKNASLPVSQRIDDLLERMSIHEKIGQMTQLDITVINTTGKQKDLILDPIKARDMILSHHVGSFLNGEAVQPQTWYSYMSELTRIAVEESRLGIPLIYGIDHIHGAGYLEGATIFPQNINLGATFNPEHAYSEGRITALESADLGHHWIFAPVLDLGVNPLWPRFWETFGEDPFLASEMGAAYVNGLQNNRETAPYKQAATGKHYLGYSDPKSGRDRTPVQLSMQQIHEFHRPSFQKAIDAGLKTIMTNSGEINGVPVVASHSILTKLLREEMKFDGVVITDWDDIGKLVDFHYTAENFKEAVFASITAGIDMSMTPLHLQFNSSLLELVEEGRIAVERINESVRRILKLKFELGLFENPFPRNDRFSRIGTRENRQKALKAACESIVLLKNENTLLPVENPRRIGVLGISANSKRNLCGGWTLTWQGGAETRYPEEMHTIYSALSSEFPDAEVHLFEKDDVPVSDIANGSAISSFLDKLNSLDLLIFAAGEEPYCEFAGNINDMRLPAKQVDELMLISRSATPLVLVLVQGRPRLINNLLANTDAVLHAGLPGFEGAMAIAGIISGKIKPSGRLPFSYPMHPNHFMPYNHKRSNLYFSNSEQENQIIQSDESPSLFPFGYGLSYTQFEYSDLKLTSYSINRGDSIHARVTVTNTGDREGTETVLWYISTHFGQITRPVKELRHFEKVVLKPGESKTLEFTITQDKISYPGDDGSPILASGTCSLIAGKLEVEFTIIL